MPARPAADATRPTGVLRSARVGDRLPSRVLPRPRVRRVDAIALLVPGSERPAGYLNDLRRRTADFAAWDGRLVVEEPDGEPLHRLLIADRYNQVYAVHDELDVDALPGAEELREWFRFLATACPECGVLDDPLLEGPTP